MNTGLVLVTTDEKGTVTDLKELEYLGYTMFWQYGKNYLDGFYIGGDAVHAYRQDTFIGEIDVSKVFRDTEAPAEHVVYLCADHKVSVVKILGLQFTGNYKADNKPIYIEKVLHTEDYLFEGELMLLELPLFDEMPTYGFAYTDADGREYKYAIVVSGDDGSFELKPIG